MALKSKEEFYALYKAAVQSADTDNDRLTDWSDGSINDMLSAAAATIGAELEATIVTEFSKTLIANTEGDERDELIVDHFGEAFARLDAQNAIGIVKFTRIGSADALTIDAGTVVETNTPVGGTPQRFVTDSSLTLAIGVTTGYASVTAQVAGPEGNVEAAEITTISPAITAVTVTNEEETSGGADAQIDSDYLAYVGNLISTMRGSTTPGLEAKLKAVPGILKATVHEKFQAVKNWNIAGNVAEGSAYSIVVATAYIADASGTANAALIAKANDALKAEKAAGANIYIVAASAQEIDWTATFVLNGAGPNYASLAADSTPILDTMAKYIESLAIGDDFVRATANAYILSVWGPVIGGGTNDITSFTTSTPSGDVSTGINIKLLPGTMAKT